MKLIDEWRSAYKMFSVQAMGLATAVLGAWMVLPDDLKATLPHWVPNVAAMVLLVAGIAGRMVQQKPKEDPDATKPG